MMIEFKVNIDFEGVRLDLFLKEQNHEILYSRTLIDKYISENKISVNGKICSKKSYQVRAEDIIQVMVEKVDSASENESSPENIPLKILYEDKYLAIIDKPAGLTVHPGAGNRTGTLVNALLYHFGDYLSNLSPIPHPLSPKNPGIVHRLDKETSGAIIITKDDKTHFEMSKLFMERQIEKSYLCLCLGIPEPLNGTIDKPISRHKTERKKMAVSEYGKEAITHYKTLLELEYFALLELQLETGRTHQIRTHLESIHHPVLGDTVYNSLKRTLGSCPPNRQTAIKVFLNKHLQRQALHAWKVKFIHPVTKNEVFVEAEIAKDILKTIDFLKSIFNYYEHGVCPFS